MAPTAANCTDAADCSHNGACSDDGSSCVCAPGWAGTHCAAVKWARDARRAFDDPLWTWGGSAIRGPDGLVHMFASELTNDCGILHYCSNSRVVHLTASDPLGPYVRRAVALEPRAPPLWDSGAVHGPTVHALPQGGYALYYMGTQLTWNGTHPSCTDTVDPNTGNRSTRHSSVATSASLLGPWTRRDAPVFTDGVLHTLSHNGNGRASAGAHAYSLDGVSHGQPAVVCTSAQNVSDCPDGGPQAGRCRTYTMCESVDLS